MTSFSVLSQIYGISSKKIFRWYKEVLSGYTEKGIQKELHKNDIKDPTLIDRKTQKKKTVLVPILKAENFGENMAIDDKNIGNEGYTIISNKDTGKIAVMLTSTKSALISEVLSKIPVKILFGVKTISADLAENYDWVCRSIFMNAEKIADKFHVIKLGLEALQAVRVRYRQKALTEVRIRLEAFREQEKERKKQCKKNGQNYIKNHLPKEERCINGETRKQVLAQSRYALFKFKSKWTEREEERMKILFTEYPEIEIAYDRICAFRAWYNHSLDGDTSKIPRKLSDWRIKTEETNISELLNFCSTVHRHTPEIVAYFSDGHTNAFAESLNAKIQRFLINNYGIRNRDFFHFRIMKFLS